MNTRTNIIIIAMLALTTGCTANRRYGIDELPNIQVTNIAEVVQPTKISGFAADIYSYSVEELGLADGVDSLPTHSNEPLFLKTFADSTALDVAGKNLEAVLSDGRRVSIPVGAIRYLEVERYEPGRKLVSPKEYMQQVKLSASRPIKQVTNNNEPFWQKIELDVGNGVYDADDKNLSVRTSHGVELKLNTDKIEYVMVREKSYVKTARFFVALAGISLLGIDAYSIFR